MLTGELAHDAPPSLERGVPGREDEYVEGLNYELQFGFWESIQGRFGVLLLGLSLIPAAVGWWLQSSNATWAFLIGGIGGGSCLLFGLIMCSGASSIVRHINRLRGGEALFRWRVDRDVWMSFAQREFEIARQGWRGNQCLLILALAGGASLLCFSVFNPWFMAILCLIVIAPLLMWTTSWFGYWLAGYYLRRAGRLHEDVWVEETGIYYNGRYVWWGKWGVSLKSIRLNSGDLPCIEVGISRPSSEGSDHESVFRFPVPAESVHEADELVQRWLGRLKPNA